MARRIRSIKPEILDDEVTAALPHLEWRLFVSLWLLADDYGNLHGRDAQIKGAALWATDDTFANVREALARLSRDGLIASYTVRGQSYFHICGWTKHQKVDHPGKAIIPGPGQADTVTCDASRSPREDSRESRESLATDQDHGSGPGTKDQERETATPSFSLASPEPAEPKPDPIADLWAEQTKLRAEAIPGSRPLALTIDRRKAVAALLKAGYSPEDLRVCLVQYATSAKVEPSTAQWFDGVSNWRPDNVARALGKVGAARAGPFPAGTTNHPATPRFTPITAEDL